MTGGAARGESQFKLSGASSKAGGPFGEADMGWARNLDILLDEKV
jgi:hypothetical protein